MAICRQECGGDSDWEAQVSSTTRAGTGSSGRLAWMIAAKSPRLIRSAERARRTRAPAAMAARENSTSTPDTRGKGLAADSREELEGVIAEQDLHRQAQRARVGLGR